MHGFAGVPKALDVCDEGLLAVGAGVFKILWPDDTPEQARFLSKEENVAYQPTECEEQQKDFDFEVTCRARASLVNWRLSSPSLSGGLRTLFLPTQVAVLPGTKVAYGVSGHIPGRGLLVCNRAYSRELDKPSNSTSRR